MLLALLVLTCLALAILAVYLSGKADGARGKWEQRARIWDRRALLHTWREQLQRLRQ